MHQSHTLFDYHLPFNKIFAWMSVVFFSSLLVFFFVRIKTLMCNFLYNSSFIYDDVHLSCRMLNSRVRQTERFAEVGIVPWLSVRY